MSGEEAWCVVVVPVHLKGLQRGWGQGLATGDLPHQHWQTIFLCTSHCAQVHCHAGTYLGPLVPVKVYLNAAMYRNVRNTVIVCFQLCDSSLRKTRLWMWWSDVHIPLAIWCISDMHFVHELINLFIHSQYPCYHLQGWVHLEPGLQMKALGMRLEYTLDCWQPSRTYIITYSVTLGAL